ncbi:hypothetical protein ASZ90_012003 [hydrocarbon metagenome]|uniref:Uncharacterized protein n=1 Tax=hydrocarbon metagenome TaxID=938273 RepID=A0A0W8FBS7_9ZZZZ
MTTSQIPEAENASRHKKVRSALMPPLDAGRVVILHFDLSLDSKIPQSQNCSI